MMELPAEDAARIRRDCWMKRLAWFFLGGGLTLYLVCDWAGVVPAAWSVMRRSAYDWREAPTEIGGRYDNFDPDLCLGVAIGETRYRLNYANHHAVVTRPLFGITDWEVPATFDFQGYTWLVSALDPFALLNAHGVRRVTLPTGLLWTNGALALADETIQEIVLRSPEGGEKTFRRPFEGLDERFQAVQPQVCVAAGEQVSKED